MPKKLSHSKHRNYGYPLFLKGKDFTQAEKTFAVNLSQQMLDFHPKIHRVLIGFSMGNGLQPYENFVLAMMAYYKASNVPFSEQSFINMQNWYIMKFLYGIQDIVGASWVDLLVKAGDIKDENMQGTIVTFFMQYMRKYKKSNLYYDEKKRKPSAIPGSKEDIEEVSDEQQIAEKPVPVALWIIPFALLIFTIFIGFKIYQSKRIRGK